MTKNEILNELQRIIDCNKDNIDEAYIFGSFAKNTDTDYSDIDVAVSCEDNGRFFDICDEINEILTMRKFDIHNIYYEKFHFDMEAVKSGIKLC